MFSVLRCTKLVCLKLCFFFLWVHLSGHQKQDALVTFHLFSFQLWAICKKKNKNFVEWVSFMLSLSFFSKRKAGFLDVQPARIGSFTRNMDSVSVGCV